MCNSTGSYLVWGEWGSNAIFKRFLKTNLRGETEPAAEIEATRLHAITTARGLPTHRGPKPHTKSRNPQKHRVNTNFCEKFRANFCLLPCDTSQGAKGKSSEQLDQMNFNILGGFFGWIFLLWTHGGMCWPWVVVRSIAEIRRGNDTENLCRLGTSLRGLTATQRSKKGSEKVLGRVLGKGCWEQGLLRFCRRKGFCEGFCNKKGFWEGGVQKVPRTPPRRVRPLRRAP